MKKVLFFLFINLSLYAQNDKITHIELTYRHAMQNFSTRVEIESSYTNKTGPVKLKACVGEKCRDTILGRERFVKLCSAIITIDPKNLAKGFEDGGDGAITTIKFGSYSNDISYSIWGVYKDDPLFISKDFLKAAQLILESANLKIEDIN